MPTLFAAFEDRTLRIDEDEGEWTAEVVIGDQRVEALAANPKAPEHLLAGTDDAGIWRSLDSGTTWNRVGEQTVTDPVTALAPDPADPSVFYAGTEPSHVYKTIDGGDRWEQTEGLQDLDSASSWAFPPDPSTHHVRWIEVDPNDPDRLYVAIEAGALIRSFDGGDSWEDRVPSGRRDTHTMATHPDAPDRAWAAAGDGFAETTDGGESWSYPQDGLDHRYCWSITVDPTDPEIQLLSAASGPQNAHTHQSAESYVYRRSGDSGWEPAGDGLPHGEGMLRPLTQRGFDSGRAYLVTNLGAWTTDSMGETWERIDVEWPSNLETQTVRSLVALP